MQGKARQRNEWIEVKAPERPSPKRAFPGLDGHEYIFKDNQWRRCEDPEEFADYTEAEAKFRSWYRKQTTRKGVPVDMNRPVKCSNHDSS
jgi:hypothetical protein